MDYFVTNFDLLAIFKNCKIVRYAEIDNYDDIYIYYQIEWTFALS